MMDGQHAKQKNEKLRFLQQKKSSPSQHSGQSGHFGRTLQQFRFRQLEGFLQRILGQHLHLFLSGEPKNILRQNIRAIKGYNIYR